MNKNYIYVMVAVIIGAVIAFGLVKQGEAKLLNVNEIGSDPSAFTGTITFTGVMGAVSQEDRSVIGVMDLKELKCTSANCNKILIPVKCVGAVPAMGDELKVTGSFVKNPTGFMFAADKLKVVRNHKIGG
ncbi:MAG: hypothetical protein A2075_24960 [Geobacteraceae bacterium GWC2_58_44]|nr:MAG: hypothetical protein A2075_24960 [Geobacteraceae bacterium GWC2_58_44]